MLIWSRLPPLSTRFLNPLKKTITAQHKCKPSYLNHLLPPIPTSTVYICRQRFIIYSLTSAPHVDQISKPLKSNHWDRIHFSTTPWLNPDCHPFWCKNPQNKQTSPSSHQKLSSHCNMIYSPPYQYALWSLVPDTPQGLASPSRLQAYQWDSAPRCFEEDTASSPGPEALRNLKIVSNQSSQ